MGATESSSSTITEQAQLPPVRSFTPGSRKLDESNIRSLGNKHYSRVQNRILGTAQAAEPPNPTLSLREGDSTYEHRDQQTPGEGSNLCSIQPTNPRISIQNISGPKKRWLSKACNKSQTTKLLCHLGALQDGKYPSSGEFDPGGRLDDKNGSQRCLLLHPNPSGTSSVASLPMEGADIRISVSAFRPVFSTTGVHQGDTPYSSMAETIGGENGGLYRRFPSTGTVQRGSSPSRSIDGDNVQSPGVLNQYREVPPNSTTRIGVSGCHSSVTTPNTSPPTNKDESNQRQSLSASEQGCLTPDYYSQGNGPVYWNSQCSSSGNSSRPPVLQISSNDEAFLSESGGGDGQLCATLEHRQGGTEMVEGTSQLMECSQLVTSSQLDKVNYRCIQLGLGSSLQGSDHRGAMVSTGELLSYQLSGDVSSLPSPPMLHKGDASPLDSLPQYGQHDCNILPESQGRNNITLSVQVSQGNLGMVHVPGYNLESQSSTWTPQHSGRQGIQSESRQMGLEASPQHISKNQPDLGTLCTRSVCFKTNTPTTSFLQLEARPSSSSNRCLPPGLVRQDLLCKPPMGTNVESAVRDQSPASRCTASGPSLEGSTVVSSPTVTAVRLSSSHPSNSRPLTSTRVIASSIPSSGSTAGRVAHLREYCQTEKLSEQASELLMASWRQKSNKSYNSLFHKWECWCAQRDRDPISGPIVDISNFLAELHYNGYAYSSLNSYRSAISSVHEHIDGKPIGQHPQLARILKGAYNQRPPTPRYSSTWKVSTVVTWLDSIDSSNEKLSLIDLSVKTVLLLALTRPMRSADLASLLVTNLKFLPEGAVFSPSCPSKQSRANKAMKDFFFPMFTPNSNLCPVNAIRVYIKRVEKFRKSETSLFLTAIPGYHAATATTIARWIKTGLSKAGIDTSIFKAHSVRSASTSAAADAGVSTSEIMEAADWSSASVFEKFYYRPQKSTNFGHSVISTASNLQSDM